MSGPKLLNGLQNEPETYVGMYVSNALCSSRVVHKSAAQLHNKEFDGHINSSAPEQSIVGQQDC